MEDEFTIGRAAGNLCQISDPHVSRFHAKIVRTSSGLEIVDLGSSGGTCINGARISRAAVRIGDEIKLAGHVQFDWNTPVFRDWYAKGNGPSEAPGPSRDTSDAFTVGRDPSCDLCVSSRYVSRRHLRLLRNSSGLILEDLGSSGGTWVKGTKARITGVSPGDPVRLANRVLLDWNCPGLKAWLNTDTSSRSSPHAASHSLPKEDAQADFTGMSTQRKRSNAGWIAGSIAAVLVVTFGILVGTDVVSFGGDSGTSSTASHQGSASASETSTEYRTNTRSTGYTSSSHHSPSSYTSSGNHNASVNSSGPSDLELTVDYAEAFYEGDVMGLVELEMEHHGAERVVEATDRLVNEAAEGRYGSTIQGAAQAVDNFSDNLTESLTGGFGW